MSWRIERSLTVASFTASAIGEPGGLAAGIIGRTALAKISDLTIALAGVVAGAPVTGGVQVLQRERERRLAGRVAARLVFGDLARAEHDIEHGGDPSARTRSALGHPRGGCAYRFTPIGAPNGDPASQAVSSSAGHGRLK